MSTSVRAGQLRQALALEYLTVGWNLVEGVVAVAAALTAGSVALLAFGIDSFVETTSGAVLVWRLLAENQTEKLSDVCVSVGYRGSTRDGLPHNFGSVNPCCEGGGEEATR